MKARVLHADLVRGRLLVYFDDGTAALFDPNFLYSKRQSEGNKIMPDDDADNGLDESIPL
jgi:hypothetical protein